MRLWLSILALFLVLIFFQSASAQDRDQIISDIKASLCSQTDDNCYQLDTILQGMYPEDLLAVAGATTIDEFNSMLNSPATSGVDAALALGDTDMDYTFTPVEPCRIVSTIVTGGAFAADESRTYEVHGADMSSQGGNASGCVSPVGEPRAVMMNVVAVNPSDNGFITAFPAGTTMPLASILNYRTGVNLGNAGAVKTTYGVGADLEIYSYSGTHLIIDVLGYYAVPAEADPTVNALGKATLACDVNEIAKWDGSAWACADDVGLTSESDPNVNALGKASLSCASGQVAKWNGSIWVCGDDIDTDTQLSEATVDAWADNNGYLTTEVDGSITNEIELPDQTGHGGKVLTTNGSAPSWTDMVTPNQSCPGVGTISGVATDGTIICSHPWNAKYVFVTSSWHNGILGGLAGADAICQGLATAAGLPGTYLAWLSDDTGSPSSRFTQSSYPYILLDGTTVASNWADLIDGTLTNAISLTDTGDTYTSYVRTGTATNGTYSGAGHCNNYTDGTSAFDATEGGAGQTGASWTALWVDWCSYLDRLYCFQQ